MPHIINFFESFSKRSIFSGLLAIFILLSLIFSGCLNPIEKKKSKGDGKTDTAVLKSVDFEAGNIYVTMPKAIGATQVTRSSVKLTLGVNKISNAYKVTRKGSGDADTKILIIKSGGIFKDKQAVKLVIGKDAVTYSDGTRNVAITIEFIADGVAPEPIHKRMTKSNVITVGFKDKISVDTAKFKFSINGESLKNLTDKVDIQLSSDKKSVAFTIKNTVELGLKTYKIVTERGAFKDLQNNLSKRIFKIVRVSQLSSNDDSKFSPRFKDVKIKDGKINIGFTGSALTRLDPSKIRYYKATGIDEVTSSLSADKQILNGIVVEASLLDKSTVELILGFDSLDLDDRIYEILFQANALNGNSEQVSIRVLIER